MAGAVLLDYAHFEREGETMGNTLEGSWLDGGPWQQKFAPI